MAKDFTARKEGESLEKWLDRISDTADTRLRQIEKLALKGKEFATAPQWAYAKAMTDIQKWGGKKRFSTKMPQTKRELMAKINDVRSFLKAPTSSEKSIRQIYNKRLETFASETPNAKGKGGYGTTFTWETMAKYYETGISKTWNEKFGSKTALRVLGVLQKNKEKLKGDLSKVDIKDLRIPLNDKGERDKFLEDMVQKALTKKYGLHIKELL